MDGRRTVGGKLEVKIRVRNPIQTKQIELVEEKWLIIG
jgi:coiled-coil and C2 domain-containing protein 1